MLLLIPFGRARWSADRLRPVSAGGGALPFECLAPHVLVDTDGGRPLRLRDGPYDFGQRPPRDEIRDSAQQLQFLSGHLAGFCDLWNAPQRQFLARYIELVRASLDAYREELEALVRPFGDVYDYRDWAFSALRPLPQAQLFEQAGAPDDWPTQRPVKVNFAFWTGTEVLAVELTEDDPRGRAADLRRERVRATGAVLVEVPRSRLADDDPGVLAGYLGDVAGTFWRGEPFPSGPFKPHGLEADLDGRPPAARECS